MKVTELKEVELIFEPCEKLSDSRGLVIDKKGYARHFHWLDDEDIANKNYKIVMPSLICTETKKVVATAWQIPQFFNLSPYDLGVMKDKVLLKRLLIEIETTAVVLPEKPEGVGWYPTGGEAMCVGYERVKLIDNQVVMYQVREKFKG